MSGSIPVIVHFRLKLFAFWNQESLLPSDTLGRLTQVFSVLYSPSTESQFLGYTTNLMLELTSRSPDYNRSVFDTPLSECKFQVRSTILDSAQLRGLISIRFDLIPLGSDD